MQVVLNLNVLVDVTKLLLAKENLELGIAFLFFVKPENLLFLNLFFVL